MLNVFHGGSLYQDIPAQHPKGNEVPHRKQQSLLIVKPNVACFHDVKIDEDSILKSILNKSSLSVNTYHHQSVKKVAPGFKATAKSADGTVEAIESTGKRFILGVQFHPEKLAGDDPIFGKIFKRFISEVRKKAEVK